LKNGPDYEEGPHSQIGEDEFYDAVETALDKFQEESEFKDKLRQISVKQMEDTIDEDAEKHHLWPLIDQVRRTRCQTETETHDCGSMSNINKLCGPRSYWDKIFFAHA
jgi:hypothetical protein